METDRIESNITCINSMQTFPDLSCFKLHNFQNCEIFKRKQEDWKKKL